ncbi:MAG TPA: hypothetical protein VMZ53_22520 [Kofleriaceae bacterium]|nr:hypothetical protein [Kofleriaceae bacterium]
MKRRLPDLSHVLDDSRPMMRTLAVREKRIHTRFDKAFLVVIGSELYGDSFAIARNISAGGLLVEMTYAPPLGTVVTVHFQYMREAASPEQETPAMDEIVARAEVKHHHYLNFTGGNDAASSRAIGLRFIEFIDPGDRVEADRIH